MDNFNLRKFLTENKLTANSRAINEGMEYLVYQIPNDAPEAALKPYIGKFLTPGSSVKRGTGDTMVSTAREYEKVGGLFKSLPNDIELTPPVALSSFGKSLGKPEVAKDDNEKPAEYRDESGRKIKNKDFDKNKVSYKLVKETDYKEEAALNVTASAKTLKDIIYQLLDDGHIQPETADDLLNAVSNSPSDDVYEANK